MRQFAAMHQFVTRDLHSLERNHIFARLQCQIVGDAHGRQDISEFGGQLPPDAGDSS